MTLEFEAALRLGAFDYEVALDASDEIVVLFGESGAGKSVTLQVVAGLARPQRGRVVIDGHAVLDTASGIDLPPQDRAVGYVVQSLALFPHLSVLDNVAFGARGSRGERRGRARQLLALLGLEGFESRMPASLSGGQQQRVALARALARDTRLLLLDEPFSALDEGLRRGLREELLRLRRELGLSVLFVTHDLREAHLLADRIAVLERGRLLQFAAREEVFARPASRRVAELTGVRNIFEGAASEGCVLVDGLPLRVANLEGAAALEGARVDVAIRAERCNLRRLDPEAELPENCYVANVVHELAFGNTHTLQLEPESAGPEVEVEVASRPYEVLGIAGRKRWVVELPPSDLHVMPRSQREAARRG